MNTLEQRTETGTSWAGKALRTVAYIAIAAAGAAGGYYAGQYNSRAELENARKKLAETQKALDEMPIPRIQQDAYIRSLDNEQERKFLKDWNEGKKLHVDAWPEPPVRK